MADRASIYVQDDRLVWAPATVLQQNAGKLVVKARRPANDAVTRELPLRRITNRGRRLDAAAAEHASNSRRPRGLGPPARSFCIVVFALTFFKGKPYTRTGDDIVVAVNPFKWLPQLYSSETREKYAEKQRKPTPTLYLTELFEACSMAGTSPFSCLVKVERARPRRLRFC